MPKWCSRRDGSCWLTEQNAYDFGYINPMTPLRNWQWPHLVFANAYACGQADHQNHAPRNENYERAQYDSGTLERVSPQVEGLTPEELTLAQAQATRGEEVLPREVCIGRMVFEAGSPLQTLILAAVYWHKSAVEGQDPAPSWRSLDDAPKNRRPFVVRNILDRRLHIAAWEPSFTPGLYLFDAISDWPACTGPDNWSDWQWSGQILPSDEPEVKP